MFLKLMLGGSFGRRLAASTVRLSKQPLSLTKSATYATHASTSHGHSKAVFEDQRQRKPLDLKDSVVKDATKARFKEFDLANRAAIITGGARGLGLAMAEVLVEAGGHGKLAPHLSYLKPLKPSLLVRFL